jgi:3-dehydroquinate dehydratase-2
MADGYFVDNPRLFRQNAALQNTETQTHSMASILVLNGPNLNMLGVREPGVYGRETLASIESRLVAKAAESGHEISCFQSNAESALIDRIHAAHAAGVAFIIINPGGLTHTSVVLRDALLATAIPFIEVHLSNVHAREPFRHHSYLSDVARGVICGLGPLGYELSLQAAISALTTQQGQ